MTKRFWRYSGLGLAVLTVGAIAACGSSDNSGGPSSGAGAPAGGAAQPGGGAAGSATAGSTNGGSTNAGAAGTGTGGAGSGFACPGTKPTSSTITEFADLVPNPTSTGNYTFLLGVPGGTFTYQAGALTLATTGMALNITGNVKAYDGFGVYLTSCTDASAYTGVSFSIKGKAGSKGMLNFRVQTNSDTAIDAVNMKGSCVVPVGTDTYLNCHASGVDIPVTADGSTVMVNFSQLTGGVPVEVVTGNDIVGLEWAFDWTPAAAGGAGGAVGAAGSAGAGGAGGAGGAVGAAGAGGAVGAAGAGGAVGAAGAGGAVGAAGAGGSGGATVAGAYDVDITIDDLKFIGGAMGGAGGGASAGAGGASAGAGGASAGAGGASAGAGGSAGAKGGAGGSAGNN